MNKIFVVKFDTGDPTVNIYTDYISKLSSKIEVGTRRLVQ